VRREQTIGLIILGSTFIAALVVSWLVRRAVHGEVVQPMPPPVTDGLAGFPEHFEPVSALDRARDLSPRKGLFGIELRGVRSNGTLALQSSAAPGFARFVLGSRRGEGPQPPVPPGEQRKKDYCGRQEVLIDQSGIRAEPDQANHSCRGFSEWLPDPMCGPVQVWQYALTQKAPPEALADLEYYQASAGPAWRFSIPNSPVHFVLYGDCKRELDDDDAAGQLP
jgi:hypothetical protein